MAFVCLPVLLTSRAVGGTGGGTGGAARFKIRGDLLMSLLAILRCTSALRAMAFLCLTVRAWGGGTGGAAPVGIANGYGRGRGCRDCRTAASD